MKRVVIVGGGIAGLACAYELHKAGWPATVVEKGLAIIGIFATFLVTLPFGAGILGTHAGVIVAITIPTALAVIGGFFLVAFNPAVVAFVLDRLPVSRQGRVASVLERVNAAAAAYRTQGCHALAQ